MSNTAITPDVVACQFCFELVYALERQFSLEAERAKTGVPSKTLVADIRVPDNDLNLTLEAFTAKHIVPVVKLFAPQIPSGTTAVFLKNPLPQCVANARQIEANGVCVSVIPVYDCARDRHNLMVKVELA